MGSREGVRVEDVSVLDVWSRLETDPGSVLIDVRTRAEWAYVGLPDISSLGKQLVLLEWQNFPDRRIDPGFATKLQAVLDSAGVERSVELFSSADRVAEAVWRRRSWWQRVIRAAAT